MDEGQHGNFTVRMQHSQTRDELHIVIMYRDPGNGRLFKAFFDGPNFIFSEMGEGVAIDFEEDAFLTLGAFNEDMARDMFFALAKSFGMDNDVKRARHEGQILGENKVLWEWCKRMTPSSPPFTAIDG